MTIIECGICLETTPVDKFTGYFECKRCRSSFTILDFHAECGCGIGSLGEDIICPVHDSNASPVSVSDPYL